MHRNKNRVGRIVGTKNRYLIEDSSAAPKKTFLIWKKFLSLKQAAGGVTAQLFKFKPNDAQSIN